jgi:septal ring factor EnvC (AmiA/AmiB activator)
MPEQFPDDWFQKRTDEELRDIRKLLGEVVPRREHEIRWAVEAERGARMQKQLDELTLTIKDVQGELRQSSDKLKQGQDDLKGLIAENEQRRQEGQMPRWFLPVLGVLVPVTTAIISHFVK